MADTSLPPLRRCTKCGIEKPATPEYFHRCGQVKSGLRPDCKTCAAKRVRKWEQENREHIREVKRKYNTTHSEQVRQRRKKYEEENKEKIKERRKEYNRRTSTQNRARVKKWQSENRDRRLKWQREWGKKNPDKRLASRRKYHSTHPEVKRVDQARRRAKIKKANGIYTKADVRLLYKSQNGKCWWCGKKVSDRYHVDHRIPLSRGGSNAPENLCISCPECNLSKNNKLPHEWNGRLL